MAERDVLTIKGEIEVTSANNTIEILSEERAKEIEKNVIQNGMGVLGLSALTNSSTFDQSFLRRVSNTRSVQLLALLAALEFTFEKGGQLRQLTNKAGLTPEEFFPQKSVVRDDKLPPFIEAIRNPNKSKPITLQEVIELNTIRKRENSLTKEKSEQDLIDFQRMRDSIENEFIGDIPSFGPTPQEIERNEQLRDILRMKIHETNNLSEVQKVANEVAKQLNETGIEGNKINEDSIKLNKDGTQGLLDIGNTQSTVASNTQQLTEQVEQQRNQLENGEGLFDSIFTVPENAASEVAQEIQQTVDNVEVPEVPLDLKFDLNEIEQALPQELLDRLNAAEVITPELDREIQEAVLKYQKLKEGISSTTQAQIEFSTTGDDTAETLQKVGENAGVAAENTDELAERTDNASTTLDGLGDLATDFSGNIENAFSDTLTSALSGDFDGIRDIWKRTLDSMFRIFTDFTADIVGKPIKVFFDQVINGKSGAGGSGETPTGDGQDPQSLTTGQKVGVGLIVGGAAISAIGSQISNDVASSIVGGIGQTASFAGLGATIGSTIPGIGTAIGAIIGAVVGLITSLTSIFSDLFKKKPRLDLDFDTFRDDVGKSTGEAAKVLDFLDEDVFNNQIFSRSVSRQAGLGLGGGLSETIREAIAGQILEIQDIIFRLPADLAADLNDALLNTAVDIESEVKGDRLLEFDETKNISQKFQQFIEGDLQARFVQSIRGFFADAFTSLGALPDAAQRFIDEQFEEFQGLSREERAEVVSLEVVRKERTKTLPGFEEEYRLAA